MLFLKSDMSHDRYSQHIIPTEQLEAYLRLNEEMAKAGVLLLVEGFNQIEKDYRLKCDGSTKSKVVHGLLDNSRNDYIQAFWLINAKSHEDALAWAKKVPFTEGELTVRGMGLGHETHENHTANMRAQEDELRVQMKNNLQNNLLATWG